MREREKGGTQSKLPLSCTVHSTSPHHTACQTRRIIIRCVRWQQGGALRGDRGPMTMLESGFCYKSVGKRISVVHNTVGERIIKNGTYVYSICPK